MRLIIDTDVGIDDAQAILIALNCPNAEVVAITTCHGNVDVDQINLNVLRVLKTADRLDIPVFSGCKTSLVGDRKTSSHYHGLDGLGDAPDPEAPSADLVQEEHAVHALIRLVDKHPGELSLMCLSPLTNIAIAMRLDPTFSGKLKECYIMGGNYKGEGNITAFAEFNFYTDPEAADVVLRELTCEVTIVPWELCLACSFSWDWYRKFISPDSRSAKFIQAVEEKTIATYYESDTMQLDGVKTYTPADQVVMAVCLCPSLVLEQFDCLASVALSNCVTRGQMIADVRSRAVMHAQKKQLSHVVTEMDRELFGEILMSALIDKQDAKRFWQKINTR